MLLDETGTTRLTDPTFEDHDTTSAEKLHLHHGVARGPLAVGDPVRATVDAVRMTEAILGWREPAYLLHNM